MDMVERVARAMADKMKAAAYSVNSTAWISGPNAGYGGPHEEMVTPVAVTLDGEFDLYVLARAAIEALREPTEEMVEAGVTAETGRTLGERVTNCHRAMIDSILKSTRETA
jgi:hypothetical protein